VSAPLGQILCREAMWNSVLPGEMVNCRGRNWMAWSSSGPLLISSHWAQLPAYNLKGGPVKNTPRCS